MRHANLSNCCRSGRHKRLFAKLAHYFGAVAFVDRHLDQQEVNEIGGIVANNRGFNGRIFNTVDEAEKMAKR